MNFKKIYFGISTLALTLIVTACDNTPQQQTQTKSPAMEKAIIQAPPTELTATAVGGTIVETMDASGYTYVKLDVGSGKDVWAAIPKTQLEIGEKITLQGGSVMNNFSSKTLERTFDEIIFASGLTRSGDPLITPTEKNSSFTAAVQEAGGNVAAAPKSGGSAGAIVAFSELKVEKATGEDAKTIAEIFTQAEDLDKKNVTVKGQIVKISKNIMGKNWIHLQDGTGEPDKNTHDLVITTSGEAEKGSIVTIAGVLAANKDFGSGYKYYAIIEDAVITQ